MKRWMKTGLVLLIAAVAMPLHAQVDKALSETYNKRYNLIVSKLGPTGVGVETVLNQWEKADPDNEKLLVARFNYYFNKSQSTQVEPKSVDRYLGQAPVLTLKDSLGTPVNYFEERFYDDSLFSMSMKPLDKAISLYPKRLDLHFLKAAALIAYEKESPDMALSYLMALIDKDRSGKTEWEYPNIEMKPDFFKTSIQEYCFTFFSMGTISSYEAFKSLSERMLTEDEDDHIFLSNLGTYNFVVLKDYDKAMKYYKKVLKINKGDYTALKNCVLLARRKHDLKMEKKYLPLLAEVCPEEEKVAVQARLSALRLR